MFGYWQLEWYGINRLETLKKKRIENVYWFMVKRSYLKMMDSVKTY